MRHKDLDSLMTSACGAYNDELVTLLEQAGWMGRNSYLDAVSSFKDFA